MNQLNKQLILDRVKVNKNDCWIWQGVVTNNGYGQVACAGKRYRPHRLAMHLWKKFDLSPDLFVCHHCDVRLCCNPEHLFIGTQSENMIDCFLKGRLRTGFKNGHKTNSGKKRIDYRWIECN